MERDEFKEFARIGFTQWCQITVHPYSLTVFCPF